MGSASTLLRQCAVMAALVAVLAWAAPSEVKPWVVGTGAVLLGEVSQCNDDNTDNRFNPPVGRFPKIEEDEPPYRLLCNEYPAAK